MNPSVWGLSQKWWGWFYKKSHCYNSSMVPFRSNTLLEVVLPPLGTLLKSSSVRSFSALVMTVWMLSIVAKWYTHRSFDNPWEEKEVIWEHVENMGVRNHCSVLGCQKLPRRQCLVTLCFQDVEAKCLETSCMPKCSVKILWTALWLLLNESDISLAVKGRSDFIIYHTLCFHLLLPWQVFLNVFRLQLHPALPDSPCAIRYFPLWSSLVSISSFQLIIHFPCTFVEFDAEFVGHNFAQYSCVHFYDTVNKHTIVYFMITWHTLNGSSLTLFCGMGNIKSFKLDSRFDAQYFNIAF